MLKNWIYNEDMPRKSLNSTQNALGAHIANLRKSAGLTQTEVAETLKIPQTTISFYEREAPYLPSNVLVALARLFGVTIEEVLGLEEEGHRRRGPKTRLERQFETIQQMPPTKQQFISKLLGEIIGK